jgi:hypothetical protein
MDDGIHLQPPHVIVNAWSTVLKPFHRSGPLPVVLVYVSIIKKKKRSILLKHTHSLAVV